MVEKGEKRTSVEAAQEDETVGKTHPFKRPKPFVTFQLNQSDNIEKFRLNFSNRLTRDAALLTVR